MDDFQFHAADVALLQMKPVQKELGVTEAQRTRMNQFADAHRAKLQQMQKDYEKAKKNPEDAAKDPRLVGYFYELKLNVMRQLKPAQLKRLSEISLQRVGLAALTDEKVSTKVGMSKDQLAKMRAAFQAGGQKYADAERKAAQPILDKYKDKKVKDQKEAQALQKQFNGELQAAMKKAQPQLAAIKAQAEKAMKTILTAAQVSKYQSLLGKPFKP
jgi:hypothetical protein